MQDNSNTNAIPIYSAGKFILMSLTGRIEKTVSAHHGAVLSIRWSPTGADLLTGLYSRYSEYMER